MKKNINMYAFIAIIVLFTVGFFITAINTSYAFPTGEETESYDNLIHLLNKSAQSYGENHPELFKDTENIYVTVDELVSLGCFTPDTEDGKVKDPRSDVKTLNDLKIRITNIDGKITTKVLS